MCSSRIVARKRVGYISRRFNAKLPKLRKTYRRGDDATGTNRSEGRKPTVDRAGLTSRDVVRAAGINVFMHDNSPMAGESR